MRTLKRFLSLLVLPVLSLAACASAGPSSTRLIDDNSGATTATLELEVHVKRLQGAVMVSLFRGEEAYSSGRPVAQARLPADGSPTTHTFTNLEPGTYGIKAYHDLDGDGAMDTNVLGIPSEPFAFSNNAAGRFGPASFGDAAFELPAGTTRHVMNID